MTFQILDKVPDDADLPSVIANLERQGLEPYVLIVRAASEPPGNTWLVVKDLTHSNKSSPSRHPVRTPSIVWPSGA